MYIDLDGSPCPGLSQESIVLYVECIAMPLKKATAINGKIMKISSGPKAFFTSSGKYRAILDQYNV